MPSSGYNAVSFTFGEQPTATKWNYLGSNDAAFKTGVAFDDSIIITRHLDAFIGVGWFDKSGESWAYSSVDGPTGVITVPSDYTTKAQVGWRVRLTQTTVKYFIITAITATTMTLYGGTDYTLVNAAISAMSISPAHSPVGFPMNPAKWTQLVQNTSALVQSSPVSGTVYNPSAVQISLPIGAWRLRASAVFDATLTSATIEASWGLSTANNSWSDNELRDYVINTAGRSAKRNNMDKSAPIVVAVKTAYFLNFSFFGGGVSDIVFRGNVGSTWIAAECAYL